MNPELKGKLEASVRRTRRNFIIVEVVLLVLSLMLIAAIFTDPERTIGTQVGCSIFGLGILFLMVKLAQMIVKPSPLLETLENTPQAIKIVEVISIIYPNGSSSYQMNLHFRTTEGKAHVLSDKRKAIEALLPLLKQQLPHAEFKMKIQR